MTRARSHIFSTIGKLGRVFISEFFALISARSFGFLFFLSALFFVLIHLGIELEVAQLVLLPFVVVSLFLLPKKAVMRPPRVLLGCIFIFGSLLSFQLLGFVPIWFKEQGLLVLDLADDFDRMHAGDRFRSYKKLAKQFNFPEAFLVHRKLALGSDTREFLNRHPKALAVLNGDILWPTVVLQENVASYGFESSSYRLVSGDERALLSSLSVTTLENLHFVTVTDINAHFVLQTIPEQFLLPSEDSDIANRFLGWILQGLHTSASIRDLVVVDEQVLHLALRRDIFLAAARVLGHWPSGGPMAVGSFFVGTIDLLEALHDASVERETLRCALTEFRRAAGFAPLKESPEVYAAIFNNAAVALISGSRRDQDLYKARGWLWHAASVIGKNGQPTTAARLALFNVMQLDRSALL